MAATDLDDRTFNKTLGGATGLAVVDFHAGWCGPCIMFKPKFKRISDEYPDVRFFMVDGEKAPKARKTVTIEALPYFAVYRDGTFVEGISTDQEPVFRAFVERHRGEPAGATP
jgi:thiol-disulfide isomerase/thioredoxin